MTPTLGQLRFAQLILKTELTPRRRPIDPTIRRLFDLSVVVTFVFFLFM